MKPVNLLFLCILSPLKQLPTAWIYIYCYCFSFVAPVVPCAEIYILLLSLSFTKQEFVDTYKYLSSTLSWKKLLSHQ